MRRAAARIAARLALAAVVATGRPAAGAPEPDVPPKALSLAQARALAAERNWSLVAARSGVQQAEGLREQAGAWPNPVAAASAGKLNLTPPGPSGSTSDTTLGVTQLLELGGKRGARIRAASAGLTASRAQLAITRVAQDAAVVKAYAAAAAAAETARVGRDSAQALEHAAAIAEVRFRAGEISAAERDQTRVAAGRFAADVRSAEAAAVQARITLQTLLGEPVPDGVVVLSDDLAALLRLATPGLAGPPDTAAVDGRGDVQAARATAEQALAQVDLQRAQRVPDLSLQAQYERDLPDNANTLGFGVSITLPLFDRNHGAIAAAQAAGQQAASEAARVRAQANAEVAASRAALAAALERHRSYAFELLPRAEAARKTVAFSYEKGLASLLELLEAERSLNEVRLAAVDSQADAVGAAADLAAARGETVP
ncbi:MAG TPA: TolC family protein [Vicinamibacteria bacterium]|nr:TolC family protein [Vicinamibacteria bacterium]